MASAGYNHELLLLWFGSSGALHIVTSGSSLTGVGMDSFLIDLEVKVNLTSSDRYMYSGYRLLRGGGREGGNFESARALAQLGSGWWVDRCDREEL